MRLSLVDNSGKTSLLYSSDQQTAAQLPGSAPRARGEEEDSPLLLPEHQSNLSEQGRRHVWPNDGLSLEGGSGSSFGASESWTRSNGGGSSGNRGPQCGEQTQAAGSSVLRRRATQESDNSFVSSTGSANPSGGHCDEREARTKRPMAGLVAASAAVSAPATSLRFEPPSPGSRTYSAADRPSSWLSSSSSSTSSSSLSVLHVIDDETLEIIPLGAGCEVGRSCIVISFKGQSVMLDCGLHPAHAGIGALPLFDAVQVDAIDLCLVTHFHLDHCGAVPYVVARTSFKGRVFMTEPTKAICKLLWVDYARMGKFGGSGGGGPAASTRQSGVSGSPPGGAGPPTAPTTSSSSSSSCSAKKGSTSSSSSYSLDGLLYFEDTDPAPGCCAEASYKEGALFEEEDVDKAMQVCETVDFHEEVQHKGVKFTCYGAGHVLGACMFLIDIGGVRLLYTGDYSREEDRHVPIAEIPPVDVHVLICESTYGIRVHDERTAREGRFLAAVRDIVVGRRGKCLLPVFALGRAQELLLILEEYWAKCEELHHIPIIYISPMANRSMRVFETYMNLCGEHVRQRAIDGDNPFDFNFVKNARNIAAVSSHIHQDGPCVVMAAPGMLQSGMSRELFEVWASDKRNGVVLTGYAVKGTPADELKKEPDIVMIGDKPIKRRCTFDQISFSAHSDFTQTQQFIQELKTPNVVLVHGERGEMTRLKHKLVEERSSLAVFTPEILQKVCLKFPNERITNAVGKLAERLADPNLSADAFAEEEGERQQDRPTDNRQVLDGVILINRSNVPMLLDPADLQEYTEFSPATLHQTLRIAYNLNLRPLTSALEGIYDDVRHLTPTQIVVGSRVMVTRVAANELVVEWESSPYADLVADSISFVALEVTRQPTPGQALFITDSMNPTPSTKGVTDQNGDSENERIEQVLLQYLEDNFAPLDVTYTSSSPGEMVVTTDKGAIKNNGEEDEVSRQKEVDVSAFSAPDEDCNGEGISHTRCCLVRFEVRDQSTGGAATPVEVDITNRMVKCGNPEVHKRVLGNLRNAESALLPLQHF